MPDELPPNDNDSAADPNAEATAEEQKRLDLNVKIDAVSACQRHITVTVSREDIDRYFEKAFGELAPNASVPGFRIGHAPRKLVESRFRKEVSEQVRASLLLDSVSQLTEDHKLAAISEPDLDPMAVEVPATGPMIFEFNIEVRPEFDLPEWKGLSIERPVRDFTDEDVEQRLADLLYERGELKPSDRPAEVGDTVAVDVEFRHGDKVLGRLEEEVVRILPVLSFHDGKIEKFDQLMKGVRPNDTRTATFKLTADAPNEELRGQEVTAEFKVLDVQSFTLPAMTPELLGSFGVDSEEGLRAWIRKRLELQRDFEAHRRVRRQVTAALTKAADWDLPPELLERQAERELERAVLELRRSGFTDAEIQAHGNELRQNSQAETARALKEHFILEKLAEQEKIEDKPEDYDAEIQLIAMQLEESPRRVRARLEKSGNMDALRNQIIERKAIELILSQAKFKDAPYDMQRSKVFAVDHAIGGEFEAYIPEAKHSAPSETPRPGTPTTT